MKKIILSCLIIVGFNSCGGGGDEDIIVPPVPIQENPVAALLKFPEKNSECTEGTNITASNSTILFTWNTSANTDSYELILKDLNSGAITNHQSSTNQLSLVLLRGTPYSWHIVSKSTSVTNTAKSETWKFYNAGASTVSYAPFPAEAVSPEKNASVNATNNEISLDWNSTDVDNDIEFYSVYFGTTSTPPLTNSNLTVSKLDNVSVVSGTKYYWFIVTTDKKGNSSISETFTFNVN